MKRFNTQTNPELLFITGSSIDQRGKRVLVREGAIENCIWPEDGVTEIDMRLLGVTPESKRHIEKFFADSRLVV